MNARSELMKKSTKSFQKSKDAVLKHLDEHEESLKQKSNSPPQN